MSNNSTTNFLDPSRFGNTGDAVTTPYNVPVERSSSDILANLESADADAIVREIVLSRGRLQKMSMLEPDDIACLYQDPNLEENCYRVLGRQPAQLDTIVLARNTGQALVDVLTTPTFRFSAADDVVYSTMPGIPGDADPTDDRHAIRARSKSVGSPPSIPPPSIPIDPGIKCSRSECKSRVLYKTQRGLREHLILKHALSEDQARHDSGLAFMACHDTVPRATCPRNLGLRDNLYTPARMRPQPDQNNLTHDILAVGNQSPASSAINSALYSVPLDASIVNIGPQGSSSLSHTQHTARQGPSNHQSELQASITSALRQDQATAFQQVNDCAGKGTPVFEHRPYIWSNDVVLPPAREPRYSLAFNDSTPQQAGMQQYIPQRYNDTWQYHTQQDDDDGYFDESTFRSGYMRWNREH